MVRPRAVEVEYRMPGVIPVGTARHRDSAMRTRVGRV